MNTHEYTRTVTIIKKEVVYIIKIYQDITIYSYFYSSISCSLSLLSSVEPSILCSTCFCRGANSTLAKLTLADPMLLCPYAPFRV